jgi:branched-chain amino acid transport system permease protein
MLTKKTFARGSTYKDLVHGGLLVLVLMFLPQGLITGLIENVKIRLVLRRRKHAQP